jgi:hypothetical protein
MVECVPPRILSTLIQRWTDERESELPNKPAPVAESPVDIFTVVVAKSESKSKIRSEAISTI